MVIQLEESFHLGKEIFSILFTRYVCYRMREWGLFVHSSSDNFNGLQDIGQGWWEASTTFGCTGLVPTGFLEIQNSQTSVSSCAALESYS